MRFYIKKTFQVISFYLVCFVVAGFFYTNVIQFAPSEINNKQTGRRLSQNVGRVKRDEFAFEKDGYGEDIPDEYSSKNTTQLLLEYNSNARQTVLNDIYISVKTTKKFHASRIQILLDTWWQLAKDQTYFFTDTDDEELQAKTNGHVINTQCSPTHRRYALCCKMSLEYDHFLESNKRWFCHVDDDSYVNIPALLRLLQSYNHTEDWYLGRPSIKHPLEIKDIEEPERKVLFRFATGGAGMCFSRSLALKMMPFTSGGKLRTVCDKIRLPDDCSLGFIIYYYLHKELTVITNFHSHLESMGFVKDIHDQITFSYGWDHTRNKSNILGVQGFDTKDDPTRFRTVHCLLNPNFKECEQINKQAS